jgi:hypothetical protein
MLEITCMQQPSMYRPLILRIAPELDTTKQLFMLSTGKQGRQ